MCLSTAYLNEKKEENVAARYVSAISAEGNKIILTDVMGQQIEIDGTLRSADLTSGFLIIGTE